MFVFSFKSSKRKIIFSTIALFIILSFCFLFFRNCNNDSFASSSIGKYSLKAKNNTERVEFLFQFGWEVTNEPLEVCEIIIPTEFNQTYENYNNIQKEQGLDLLAYAGKACKRYTYEILNYEDKAQGVRANMLILDDKVIGGDVCSIELNGFMHGFMKPDNSFDLETFKQKKNALRIPEKSTPELTEETTQTTYKETLAPDVKMPHAPVD